MESCRDVRTSLKLQAGLWGRYPQRHRHVASLSYICSNWELDAKPRQSKALLGETYKALKTGLQEWASKNPKILVEAAGLAALRDGADALVGVLNNLRAGAQAIL